MSVLNELDFPPNLMCLKNVDNMLRCPICFDYLNISMMAQQCSHTFCSLCIRKFLSYKSLCPVCNFATTELDLRNNRILDDIVKSFQSVRKQLSRQVNFESPPMSPKTLSLSARKITAQKREGTLISHFLQKAPPCSPAKELRPLPGCEVRQQPAVDELHSDNDNMKGLLLEAPSTGSSSSRPDLNPSPATSGEASSAERGDLPLSLHPASTTVECPVCSVGILQQYINKHLDSCLTREEKKESLRSSLGKRKPLAKVVYTLLSLQELKKRLKDFHLSAQGTREQLIRRHQDFVHMYNAQCDSLDPKSAEDIAKEVEKNERMRTQLQSKSKTLALFSKSQTDKEIEAAHSNYRKQHSDEFSRLIAQVKSRWKTSKKVPIDQEDREEDGQRACPSGDAEAFTASEEKNLQSVLIPRSPRSLGDVSISSSTSDVFSPDPDSGKEHIGNLSHGKRKASSSRDAELMQEAQSCKRSRQT